MNKQKNKKIKIKGKVINGFGKGAFFLSREPYKSFFKGLLGNDPFPGTLNVKLDRPWKDVIPLPNTFQPVEYGGISYAIGSLNGLKIIVLRPHKSQHPQEVIEIVASKYLRKELKITNGNYIEFEVYV